MKRAVILLFIHMQRVLLLCSLFFVSLSISAGVTTYTFTSKKWTSKVEAVTCDGKTDGWLCDKEAYEYMNGRVDAQGRLYSQGVSVKTSTTGAGATSVVVFEEVRRITFNFCQNSSKGRGIIYVQVGDHAPDSIVITKPAQSGQGVYNRDSIVAFNTPQTGKIKFWVTCKENAININTITIRSANGGSSPFTTDTYQLVTDITQLQDSDQVIVGVAKENCNYIMGYFDETKSVNNIHAIKAAYSVDRMQVAPDESAIYTLRTTTLDGEKVYLFQDELRYGEAYLVASGGKTKNRLALWNKLIDEKTYGNYGYWSIDIHPNGEAVITNKGNSVSKIIQYNAVNNPTLFGCYATQSQTPICLYRRVEALGDIAAIVAPMVYFGTTIETVGERTIEVTANRLMEDIQVSLTNGSLFTLSASILDRDGDQLTIRYENAAPGYYVDTLILQAGTVEKRVPVMLNRVALLPVNEAVKKDDYTLVYLNDVVVTKKYDTYIYVRDNTGSMLIYDNGDGETGKRYGAGLKTGDVLTGVSGRMYNYYGVPELSPVNAWIVTGTQTILPEQAEPTIDSADVCRYLQLDSVVINENQLTYKGKSYAIANKFNLPDFIEQIPTSVTCIVSYDWDVLTLYIVSQTEYTLPEAINKVSLDSQAEMIMQNGMLLVHTKQGLYTLTGQLVSPQ